MKWFKCFVEGKNFPGELINEEKLIGFYTTRFAEAISPDEAEKIVLSNLKKEKILRLSEEVKLSDKAKVFFEEIEEINKSEVPEMQEGFVFYTMDT